MTMAASPGLPGTQSHEGEEREIEEPGGHGRALRAHRLRYDRLAGWLSLAGALIWALIVIRGWIFPGVFTSALPSFPVEKGLAAIAGAIGLAWVVGGLVGFAALDCAIGLMLLRGENPGLWRFAARARAAVGLALCVFYYLATRDFPSALFFGALQGLALAFLSRNSGLMLVYPSALWLGVFFLVPLLSVLAYSLGRGTALGTVDLSQPSLDNFARIVQPVGVSGLVYINIILRTAWIAFLTTIICLVVAYPFAFWMARQPQRMRNTLMLLVMIPFWTNILIRTYAWLIILRKDGILNNFLIDTLGLIDRPLELVNTPGALLLGLVYGYLPYMILPLYSSIERLDGRLVEAANDLYARPWQAFWRVVFPLTIPGVIAGSILVFIPAIGSYVVGNLLGGGKFFLIGNVLEQQFLGSSGNKAFGAAFGVVLTVVMLIATLVYFRLGRGQAGGDAREGKVLA
jgi:spermidine/putrescine transport system permease protein